MPDNQIRIFDTTLRDGEQAPGCSMTLREKLRVARALSELNVDIIEAGFPAASGEMSRRRCRSRQNTLRSEVDGIEIDVRAEPAQRAGQYDQGDAEQQQVLTGATGSKAATRRPETAVRSAAARPSL